MQSKLILFALFSFICCASAAINGNLYVLSTTRYNSLVSRMSNVLYSDQRAGILRDAIVAYGFNCSQIAGFLPTFKSDGDKLFVLDMLRSNIIDPANKQQILDLFNRTDDRERAFNTLNSTVACKVIPNPADSTPAYEMSYSNIWSEKNLTDLIKVIDQIPISVGKIKVAEVSIMSQTEVLIPEQLMRLFGAYPNYRDILTLKEAIRERIVGITSDQLSTLLQRFSFENQKANIVSSLNCSVSDTSCPFRSDLIALSEFVQGSLAGDSCSSLAPLFERFSFEEEKLAILEGFYDGLVDTENKWTILDVFFFANSKERARKILETFKPNSYLFGNPSGKTVFVLDTSGSMSATFKVNGQTFTRLDFVKKEYARVLSSFNENMSFSTQAFSDKVVAWTNTLVNATQTNVKSAIEFANRQPANGGTASYDALKFAFNVPGVQEIYFLSDGTPNVGAKTTGQDIVNEVRVWNANRNVKIHSIVMLMGTASGESKPQAKAFMKMLSDVTGGTYRALDSDN